MKNNLHIIIYSSFPKYSGGRENWLANVLPRLSAHFEKIFLYTYTSNRNCFYDLSCYKNLVLVEISGLRRNELLFSIINFLLLRLLYLYDSLIVFNNQTKSLLSKNVKPGDTILAMNSIIELQPAINYISSNKENRLICSIRGLVPYEMGKKVPFFKHQLEKMESKLLSQCPTILVNGYDTQEYIRKKGFKSYVVPNGVHIDRFQSPYLLDPTLVPIKELKENQIKIIMMVASLRTIKGIDDLLISGSNLQTHLEQQFKLVFVGKGNSTPYRIKAKKLGIEDKVLFLGEQKNIAGLLYYADVVVCLSGGSGMSMAALEAMASSKPIVAWNSMVYKQLITHMKNGYLAAYMDHSDLAKGIKLLINDELLRMSFKQQLKEDITKYDWDNVIKELVTFL